MGEEAYPRCEGLPIVEVGGDVLAEAVGEDQRAAGTSYDCIDNTTGAASTMVVGR